MKLYGVAEVLACPSCPLNCAPGHSTGRTRHGANAPPLLVPAQVACQTAKERGRGRVEVYESADASIIRRVDDLNLVGSIRSAIEDGRLVLFAQPIVNLTGNSRIGYYELLVRMLSTSGELISPAEFMRAAERYHLMQEIDLWVVGKAIRSLALIGPRAITWASLSGCVSFLVVALCLTRSIWLILIRPCWKPSPPDRAELVSVFSSG